MRAVMAGHNARSAVFAPEVPAIHEGVGQATMSAAPMERAESAGVARRCGPSERRSRAKLESGSEVDRSKPLGRREGRLRRRVSYLPVSSHARARAFSSAAKRRIVGLTKYAATRGNTFSRPLSVTTAMRSMSRW